MAYHCGDQVFDTLEEMRADYRSRMSPWDKAVSATWYPVRRRSRDAQLAVKYAYQRVARGYDDRSTWNLNCYLPKFLGQQLVTMAEIAHGYPGEHYPFDQWTADLRRHGEALLTFHKEGDDSYGENWDTVYVPAQEALRWVAENLAYLWD